MPFFEEELEKPGPRDIVALTDVTPNRATVYAVHPACDHKQIAKLAARYGRDVAIVAIGVETPEKGERVWIHNGMDMGHVVTARKG